jgi:radical SAM superfamily enzyme YgiQ (UPF0313 family)
MRKEGFEVSIIDAQACGLALNGVLNLIKSIKPNYVGITASTMAINSATQLAGAVKTLDSKIKIIIGGCHVSALPEEAFKKNRCFDIGVIGEGEDTIRELIFALDNDKNLEIVKGIIVREDGGFYISEPRPRIKNIDDLPYPAFDLLPDIKQFYRLPIQSLTDKYSFSLITSRGCSGRCSFCDKKVFGNYISMHSAEYITDMICVLNKKYKITNILFEDDNFMFSKPRLEKLANLINKRKLKIRWASLARIDSIDKDILKIAKDGGCWQIAYGIESGSQRILDFYKKGITLEQVRSVIELTKKLGLKVKCFFMWGNPTEDKNSIKETVSFIKTLNIDDISVTFFTPYPGSEIWPNIEPYGNLDRGWQKMSCFELVFKPHSLDYKYLIKTRKGILRYFYLRPKIIISYLMRIRSAKQLRELILSFYYLFCYLFKKSRDV